MNLFSGKRMMLMSFLYLLFMAGISHEVTAQQKIVWEIASGDTSVQRMLYRQINNVLNAAPDTKIELVYHGQAIYALLNDTGHYKTELKEAQRKVTIAACNNSLKNRGIDTSRLITNITIVPVAVLEIAKKQSEGWSYIRAGH
jgi:intracellular sulfur oxidation DsrE/DsrF family protein